MSEPNETLATDPSPVPPPKKKSEWAELFTPRTIVATSALFVSILSLIVTLYQMQAERKVRYAGVLPYVTCLVSNGKLKPDSTGTFKMVISNKGVGPAFIHYVRIKCGDMIFDGNNHEEALQCIGNLDQPVGSTYSFIAPMDLLPAGDQVSWFEPHDSVQAGRIMLGMWSKDAKKEVDFIICFSDVYQRKWVFHSSDYKVTPCDDCPDYPINQ